VAAIRKRRQFARDHPGTPCPGDGGLKFAAITVGLWITIHLVFLGGARYFFPVMPILVALAARQLTLSEPAA
jgi:hypothetical protein